VVRHPQACHDRHAPLGRDENMNRYLTYQDGELLFEDVALSEIAQDMYTPFYVYSKAAILEKVEAFKQAFSDAKPMIAYGMKALDTTIILKILQERGCAVKVSNVHEMERALAAGFEPTSIILNSNGLPDHEIEDVLRKRPLIFNVGNIFELEHLNRVAAKLDTGVRIGLRINLGIDGAGGEETRFGTSDNRVGIPVKDVNMACALIEKFSQLNLVGISAQIGSQVAQLAPWIKMTEEMVKLYKTIKEKGFNPEYLDLGGGFPVQYLNMDTLEIKKIARNIIPHLKDIDCRLVLSPGRYFVAEAGVLVTSVLGVKEIGNKYHVICDAGFAELPSLQLHSATHEVATVKEPVQPDAEKGGAFALDGAQENPIDVATGLTDPGEHLRAFDASEQIAEQINAPGQIATSKPAGDKVTVDLVGPGDEGLDYLAKNIEIPLPSRGDLIAILNVGAYGRTMANNYTSRLTPPEILIERDKFETIRSRQFVDDLIACDLEESEIDA